jgi:hypothetical protein
VEQHRVARPHGQARGPKRGLGVPRCQHLAGAQAVGAAHRGDVQQQAAGDDLGQGVDAEPVGAPVLDDVGQPVAVVGPVADLEMVEAVQVGAHLLGSR